MTLLVDNQLPVALAPFIAATGWDCVHVQDVGLNAADDRIISPTSLEARKTTTYIRRAICFQAVVLT